MRSQRAQIVDRGLPKIAANFETRHSVMNSHAQAVQTILVTLTVMGDATAVIAVLELSMSNPSEHYRCAERNQLCHSTTDLGTLHVGTAIHHAMTEDALPKKGYRQSH